jgi:hypothetical protein
MNSKKQILAKDIRRFGMVASLLGVCCYLVLSAYYARHLTGSVWDESAYVFKGYLFAAGKDEPFSDFGPWTNHMPLAFLLPGYIQLWFGPSLAAARTNAVVLGLLTLLGLWLIGLRIGGVWWGAAAVWTVVLNPGWVKVFSQVFSQGLVCMLVAVMLAFCVGEGRKTWELYLAAFLAGLIAMTRIDLFPVLVLYLVYIGWQRGWKTMWRAVFFGALPVVFLHVIYWPDILKLWAYWLPEGAFPFLSGFRSPWREVFLPADFSWWPISTWWVDRNRLAWFGIETLWLSLRANMVPFLGALLSVIFWPRDKGFHNGSRRKLALFLLAVYLVQVGVHIWVSIGGHSCQFSCLIGYLMFSNFFGLTLAVVIAADRKDRPFTKPQKLRNNIAFGLFGLSIILQPAPFFVRGLDAQTCAGDVTADHARAGYELSQVIPQGERVFWDVKSNMLLLYLPEVEIFPPQLSYRLTLVDDPDADWNDLQRFGWWNNELGEDWISRVDYAVVENRFFYGLWQWGDRVASGEFEVVFRSPNPESCRAGISNVVVLKRTGGE